MTALIARTSNDPTVIAAGHGRGEAREAQPGGLGQVPCQ